MEKSIKERFFKNKFTKTGPNGCWIWHRAKSNGYGVMFIDKNTTETAHRISYEIHYGVSPKGGDICHKCDNPACVNPKHLFLGDAKSNAFDMIRKGRGKNKIHLGEENGNRKLTKKEVLKIRSLAKKGFTYPKIANLYNVDSTNIGMIVRRRTWRHI